MSAVERVLAQHTRGPGLHPEHGVKLGVGAYTVIAALGRANQEEWGLRLILSYIARSRLCLKIEEEGNEEEKEY